MRIFITGGAGFIGSHLANRLIELGNVVTVYDNFSSGSKDFLHKDKNLKIIKGDVLNHKLLTSSMRNHQLVYHLSANADVSKGTKDTQLDLQQETIATHSVLEAMRLNKITKLVFPSSMTVYGVPTKSRVSEEYGPCLPISLYGAAKLANEAMIHAYCELFDFQAYVLRFANVIGGRATHGVIFDLINKLKNNQAKLEVLGNGKQEKQYIFIDDIIEAMLFIQDNAKEKYNLYNVGTQDTILVKDIAKLILSKKKLKKTKLVFGKTAYGWKGDVTKFHLDSTKLKKLGFKPRYSTKAAVEKTIDLILEDVTPHG